MERRVIRQADGKRLILERIEPPASGSATDSADTSSPPVHPAQETAPLDASLLKQPHEILALGATVHSHAGVTCSLLTWWHEGTAYQLASSIDFRLFTGLGGFEWNGMSYSLLLAVGEAVEGGQDLTLPSVQWPRTVDGVSDYLVLSPPHGAPPAALAGVEALHAWHDAHLPFLEQHHAARQQAEVARAAAAAAAASAPRDVVIRFWPRLSIQHGVEISNDNPDTQKEDAP